MKNKTTVHTKTIVIDFFYRIFMKVQQPLCKMILDRTYGKYRLRQCRNLGQNSFQSIWIKAQSSNQRC